MAWPFQSPTSGISPVDPAGGWTDVGAAIRVRKGDAAPIIYGVVATSTSTVVVDGVLWLYGIPVGSSVPESGSSGPSKLDLVQTDNVPLSSLPPPSPGQWNIAYLASGPDFTFDIDLNAVARGREYALQSTGIPSQAARRVLDGFRSEAVYKDAHVLELKDGKGWLMLLARYHSRRPSERVDMSFSSESTVGENDLLAGPGPEDSSSAIVGYWCQEPTFTTGVKGSYFLVSRFHTLTFGRGPTTGPLWLGVPAACELEVDGVSWLYVYYTAESTEYENPDQFTLDGELYFPPGTYAKRIDTRFLPWGNSFGLAFENQLFATASTDETSWDSQTHDEEVFGEYLGKVYIWVAEGMPWREGEFPDLAGNRMIWDVYASLKDVDAVPVVFDRGVALYFSANDNGATTGGREYAWGIWRAVLGPAALGRAYGMDFVVRPVTLDDLGGSHDLVARSNPLDVGAYADSRQMRLDPDPVRLPSGDWVVFTGAVDGDPPDPPDPLDPLRTYFLERFEAGPSAAEATYHMAWP